MMIFAYDLAHWAAFFTAVFFLNLSPGPDTAFVLSRTLGGGRTAGLWAMSGTMTGALLHVVMAVLGLSAILAASATAFTAIKIIGALYLIWLGVQALRTGGGFLAKRGPAESNPWKLWRQALFVNLMNPKAVLFFLVFLPQFTSPTAGPVPAQLLLHGLILVAVSSVFYLGIVLLAERLTVLLSRRPSVSTWIDRTLGVTFIGFGAKLALSRS
ncbi:LysE family translocator [Paracoccaceae bacterium GXU_MW_L88]